MRARLSDLARAMPLLSSGSREFGIAARLLGLPDGGDAEVDGEGALMLAAWEWLVHLGFVDAAQRRAVAREVRGAVSRFAAEAEAGGDDRRCLPCLRLAIVEQRYAAWAGGDRYYDFVYEAWVDELEAPPITTIVCDLTAAYCRLADRLAALAAAGGCDVAGAAKGPPG